MCVTTAADITAVLNAPVGGYRDAARLRADIPGVAHADAAFGADHANFTRVHPTEAGDIQRHLRASRRVVAGFSDVLMFRIHLVTPGSHIQLVRPHSGVDLNRAGNNVGVIGAGAVQPPAVNADFAALNVIAGQLAVIHLRLPGGQRAAVGVNKAAAVTGNACRVGNHHLRFFPGHFHVTIEAARIAGVHFVEDNPGFAFAQPRVARHHAAQLRLDVFMRVIKNHALLVNVELAVFVMRDACGGRRLNIDLRRTVSAVDDGGLLICRCAAVCHHVSVDRLYHTRRQPQTEA